MGPEYTEYRTKHSWKSKITFTDAEHELRVPIENDSMSVYVFVCSCVCVYLSVNTAAV